MTNSENGSTTTGRWSSRFVFLMAAIGAAVGLGNLWRFPFQTGENGGAAFVILYLACVFLIGLPILLAELAIGRSKQQTAVRAIRSLAVEAGKSPLWAIGGWVGASASALVLPIYSVIAGKIMAYSAMAFAGMLTAGSTSGATLYGGAAAAVAWMTVFLGATTFIVARGLRDGVEKTVAILMPAFFVLLLALSLYALISGNTADAIDYLFSPRWSEVTGATVLAALGQAMFSLAVGGAVMITYGAFLDDKLRLTGNAALIAGADTLVALIAGLMIFPIVFAHALDPGAGMGLIFDALPQVFAGMPAGRFIGGLFFALAFVAAITSSISMLMMSSSIGQDEFGWRRGTAIWVFAGGAWVIGVASAFHAELSHGLDFLVGDVLLPLGALASSLVAGWIAPRAVMRAQTRETAEWLFQLWRLILRYAAPMAIIAIFAVGIDAKLKLGVVQAIAEVFAT